MPFNIKGAVEVALEVFGGRVTEQMAVDVPEGVSPDEQDNTFVPGSVASRPCLQRVLLSSYDASTCTYQKSCVFPNGWIRNLYLFCPADAPGALVWEDPINAPGVVNLLLRVPQGSYAKSATAFGREWIAVSDTLHGATIPYQWDGTNLDRATQDGPATPPTVTNLALPPSTLSSSTGVVGDFIILPVLGGGTVAIGAGSGAAQGSSIPLPDGYETANLMTWSTAGAGTNPHDLYGVAESVAPLGVLNTLWSINNGGGSPTFAPTSNWAAVTWSTDANVTFSTVTYGGTTFKVLTFTTIQGDELAVVTGLLADGASMYVPPGFSDANWASMQGAATINSLTNVLDYIDCYFGPSEGTGGAGTVLTCRYSDFALNRTYGSANVLGIFWQLGGGVTTTAVTGGTAVLIPTFTGVTAAVITAVVPNAGSFSIPAGHTLLDSTTSVQSALGPAGSNSAVGMSAQACTGLVYGGAWIDIMSRPPWYVNGNVFALSTMGTLSTNDLTRVNNTVTATTLPGEPHNLQVGYQAQISGVPATSVGGGIASIVVDNENNPGIATVTTESEHGLLPENLVTMTGIEGAAVGGLATTVRAGGIVTATLTDPANLQPGSLVTIDAVEDASFNGSYAVLSVPSPTTFTYYQTDADGSSTGGTVALAWPIPSTGTPVTYEVLSAPTPTSFQIALNYADGEWSGGDVYFGWDGTFYVTKVIDPLTFQYQQYGPDATSSAAGQVTPFGQAAPGKHLCRVTFLTRNGAVLKSSPWVQFIANGGQYLQVENIAIGPAGVTAARIVEFTGADGSYFFYLPVQPQVNGLIVGTATQINDNTTTSAVFDFGDPSLFAGIATSIPGNDLNSQIVLDGALGFGLYGTRLITYGQRNRLQTLLNMGFDGGYVPSAPTVPTGWTVGTDGYGSLGAGLLYGGWVIDAPATGVQAGVLSQGAYQAQNGNPILTASTDYLLRVWLQASAADAGLNFYATLSSASTGFTATATVNGAGMSTTGGWFTVALDDTMPETIPEDMLLTIYATSSENALTLTVDELSLIYAQTPYLDLVLFGSYGNNPEGMDGVSGKFGPVTDTRKVMDFGVLRETFYMLTQDPTGRVHETTDNGTTEPSGWDVNEVGANCGALSAFSLTKSQADDTAASGGEEWFVYASSSGSRIFGGAYPDKISQEIQPDWAGINPAAALTIWSLNDPVGRAIYTGVPLGAATAPNKVLFMSYRQLDSAQAIAQSPPFRVSFTGKLIATDNSRKWSLWNVQANCGALMYRAAGALSVVLGGGNGQTPGLAAGYGQVYTLNPAKYTDDDYGQMFPYYFTCAMPTSQQEQALQLGGGQKELMYLTAYVQWVGQMTVTAYPNALSNPWSLNCVRTVSQENFDLEWGGAYARGSRIFLKFAPIPLADTTDVYYNLQRLAAYMAPAARLKVRGAAQ